MQKMKNNKDGLKEIQTGGLQVTVSQTYCAATIIKTVGIGKLTDRQTDGKHWRI